MTFDQPLPVDHLVETLDRRYCHPGTARNPDPDIGLLLDLAGEVPDLRAQLEEARDEAARLAEWMQDYAEQILRAAVPGDLDEIRRIAHDMRALAAKG